MSDAGNNGTAVGPAIPASAATLLRFQVGRKDDEPERADVPVYLLAAPTDRLILAYRAGCVARGIRLPAPDEMAGAMALAIERTKQLEGLDPKVYDWHRSLIERALAFEDSTPKYERLVVEAGLNELEEALAASDPGVQKLRQKRTEYGAGSMRVACAVALRGWEHRDGRVEVAGLEATQATLDTISDDEQQAIGLYWLVQRNLTDAQKKTSDSPPPLPTTPTTTHEPGAPLPSSTDAPAASRRSRGTRSGTKPATATPVT